MELCGPLCSVRRDDFADVTDDCGAIRRRKKLARRKRRLRLESKRTAPEARHGRTGHGKVSPEIRHRFPDDGRNRFGKRRRDRGREKRLGWTRRRERRSRPWSEPVALEKRHRYPLESRGRKRCLGERHSRARGVQRPRFQKGRETSRTAQRAVCSDGAFAAVRRRRLVRVRRRVGPGVRE